MLRRKTGGRYYGSGGEEEGIMTVLPVTIVVLLWFLSLVSVADSTHRTPFLLLYVGSKRYSRMTKWVSYHN